LSIFRSCDLYSKSAHFVLELVQNADDNSYAAGVVPTIEFHQKGQQQQQLEELVVCNNERGFREGDVEALCDVSRSTKTAKTAAGGFIYWGEGHWVQGSIYSER
jgi:hypothetical protein